MAALTKRHYTHRVCERKSIKARVGRAFCIVYTQSHENRCHFYQAHRGRLRALSLVIYASLSLFLNCCTLCLSFPPCMHVCTSPVYVYIQVRITRANSDEINDVTLRKLEECAPLLFFFIYALMQRRGDRSPLEYKRRVVSLFGPHIYIYTHAGRKH